VVSTREQEWVWEVRLECGFFFGAPAATERKDYVREHKEFLCPSCDLPQRVTYFSARGL